MLRTKRQENSNMRSKRKREPVASAPLAVTSTKFDKPGKYWQVTSRRRAGKPTRNRRQPKFFEAKAALPPTVLKAIAISNGTLRSPAVRAGRSSLERPSASKSRGGGRRRSGSRTSSEQEEKVVDSDESPAGLAPTTRAPRGEARSKKRARVLQVKKAEAAAAASAESHRVGSSSAAAVPSSSAGRCTTVRVPMSRLPRSVVRAVHHATGFGHRHVRIALRALAPDVAKRVAWSMASLRGGDVDADVDAEAEDAAVPAPAFAAAAPAATSILKDRRLPCIRVRTGVEPAPASYAGVDDEADAEHASAAPAPAPHHMLCGAAMFVVAQQQHRPARDAMAMLATTRELLDAVRNGSRVGTALPRSVAPSPANFDEEWEDLL